jgi:hypothetical protein
MRLTKIAPKKQHRILGAIFGDNEAPTIAWSCSFYAINPSIHPLINPSGV